MWYSSQRALDQVCGRRLQLPSPYKTSTIWPYYNITKLAHHAGGWLPLLRVAASLFEHVSNVLQASDILSQVGLEYGALLRTLLLPIPEYCAQAAQGTFQGKASSCRVTTNACPELNNGNP